MRFTPAQQQAITARNRELLVSAAAGSGKTAVLVERILRLIAEDGLSIDRMLIVTFTRAAASEMRERLETRLHDAAGGDARLRHQADLVASAQISTIHSFCQSVVRQHFQYCGVDPQFGLCDERTRAAFYQESMEETLDWLYTQAKDDEDLMQLARKFSERDTVQMMDALYRFLMSRPDPMDWLSRHAGQAWSLDTLDEGPMARTFCQEAALIADGMLALWQEALSFSGQPAFPPPYLNTLMADGETLRTIRRACDQGLTSLISAMKSCKFVRLAIFRPKTTDEEYCANVFKGLRDRWKDMAEEIGKLLPSSAEEAVHDLCAMAPATRGMQKAVSYFHQAFSKRKHDQAVIDFNDLEHMTLSALRQPLIRQEQCERFDAIFVDEYQDVSELQEAILNALKRQDGPKQYAFYVGDVKQSIYRFRLAEPELFLGKLSRFSAEEDAQERRIVLNRNFRSKTAVLHAVNRVFEHVMDSRVTEIDYDDDAKLYPGTPSQGDPQTELHILNAEGLRPQDQVMAEAEFIARDILDKIGTPVVDGEGNPSGTLHYRDIAILLPVSKNVADKVELVLTRAGIPVYSEGAADAMGSDEVSQLIQYLSLMDNLMNDVALLSVLRSPLFEMTEQELSAIRLVRPEREASFLTAVTAAASGADEPLRTRCADVLRMLENERFYIRSMSLSAYLWDFLGRSGLYAHFGAQPGGRLRQANLRMLCHRADEYEKNHSDGLHGFVETLLMDSASGGEGGPAIINPWDDVVRIMTIHKSKGLEFPTVYVMNLGRSMFGRGQTRAVSVHGEMGFGLGYVNEEARTRRATILQNAIALREKNAERAERARVLYVALTRPKSRLVMVGSDTQAAAGPDALCRRMENGTDVYAVRQAGSMLDWIVQCVQPGDTVEELSTEGVRKIEYSTLFSTKSTSFPHSKASWRIVFHINPDVNRSKVAKKDMLQLPVMIPQTVEKLISGVQPRSAQTEDPLYSLVLPSHAPLKVGVTALCRAIEEGEWTDEEETADTKRWPLQAAQPRLLSSLPAMPAFLEPPREERALQTGVQTHRLLGLMELDAIRAHLDNDKAVYAAVCRELERLTASGVFTQQEADYVSRSMAARFLQSNLGRRMLASAEVHREWSFNLRIAQPFATVVQGVIDLCFVEDGRWVLVDFKTDHVENAQELLARYQRQVQFYAKALTEATPYPVAECWLYALRLGEAAPCNTGDGVI